MQLCCTFVKQMSQIGAIESIDSSRFIQIHPVHFQPVHDVHGSLEDPYGPLQISGAWHTQCEAQELRHGSAKTRRQPGDVLLCDSRRQEASSYVYPIDIYRWS